MKVFNHNLFLSTNRKDEWSSMVSIGKNEWSGMVSIGKNEWSSIFSNSRPVGRHSSSSPSELNPRSFNYRMKFHWLLVILMLLVGVSNAQRGGYGGYLGNRVKRIISQLSRLDADGSTANSPIFRKKRVFGRRYGINN